MQALLDCAVLAFKAGRHEESLRYLIEADVVALEMRCREVERDAVYRKKA